MLKLIELYTKVGKTLIVISEVKRVYSQYNEFFRYEKQNLTHAIQNAINRS